MNEKLPGAATPNETREGQRIAKVMARAGLCSRRDAEAWILEGRVSVNGKILESPAFNVTADDDIRVDGKQVQEAERTRLFLFHKPRGLVTTARDPEGRSTIFDALPEDLPRVVAIGRLDINTEGLLLLTNDGGLARVLELPATGWLRRYRVRAHGAIEQAQLDALREGVTIDGVHYAGIEARLEREQGSNVWLMMGLREGKNREIKRVLEHLGMSVNRLIRVSFGPFELGDLAEGEVAEVRTRVLRDQLGAKLAREAGVIFDGEVMDHATPAPTPPAAPKRAERSRAGARPRPDRAAPERTPIPKSEPVPPRVPRKRKHVSTLRAEADAETSGPRRRIERSATSDRKGREIKVERIVAARGRKAEPSRGDARPFRKGPPREGASEREARPARSEGRSFEKRSSSGEARAPSREGKTFSKRPPSGGSGFAPRGEGRSFEKRSPAGERRAPAREGRTFSKRPPSGGEGARPPRAEGRTFEKRAPSGEGRSFEKRGPSGEGRAPSREGRTFSKRPPSGGEGARPPRGEGRTFEKRAPSGEGRSFEKRSSSGEGRAPSREGKPFGKRPFGEGARPPRGEGRTFEKRAPSGEGRSFEKRGPSGEGRPPSREGRTFSKRPPAGDGARPPRGEGRSFEKRSSPGEGRPPSREGKTFSKRPPAGEGGRPPRGEGRTFEKRGPPRSGPGGKRPPRRP